jgi:hypothetical protein
VTQSIAAAAAHRALASTMGTSATVVMPEALARDLAGPAMESAIARLTPDARAVAA